MSSRQKELCAARMSPAAREKFLALLEEGSRLAKEAWQLYYADTGLKPRFPGRPKTKPDPLPLHIINNSELFTQFVAWRSDLKFKLGCCDDRKIREKVFAAPIPSRDRIREMFNWAKQNGCIVETRDNARNSMHKLWRVSAKGAVQSS